MQVLVKKRYCSVVVGLTSHAEAPFPRHSIRQCSCIKVIAFLFVVWRLLSCVVKKTACGGLLSDGVLSGISNGML